MIVVLFGVSGSGKTTIGKLLSEKLGWPLFDADGYHPAANVEKMRSGVALTDADRRPWLDRLNTLLREQQAAGQNAILACSALKQAYRDRLADGLCDLFWIHLKGDFELIDARLKARRGHYMPPSLLRSQFATLEEPRDAITVDVTPLPDDIARDIAERLIQPRNDLTTASVARDNRN
ncbi:MAG: gluconokinase [Burkholderiales bacterium]